MARNDKGNDQKDTRKANGPQVDENLTEEVLKDAGKGDDEIESTGKMDRADDETEKFFGPEYRTVNSPVHKVFWESLAPQAFIPNESPKEQRVRSAIIRSIAVVQHHRKAGTLYGATDGKITRQVFDELGEAGYWGMLIDPKYGGQGAKIQSFTEMLTAMSASGDPTTAGLASVHGCIGAVDPVRTFGTDAQKEYFLPKLASGKHLSGFALTEKNAGSDLTALRTVAYRDGKEIVIVGAKMFITNAVYGHIVGVVVKMLPKKPEGVDLLDEEARIEYLRYLEKSKEVKEEDRPRPAVIIVELPAQDTPEFQIYKYDILALTHANNNGLIFKNFRVPEENLLKAPGDNGLIIAYHGLNYGRLALCANAAGVGLVHLKSMVGEVIKLDSKVESLAKAAEAAGSWIKYRQTYGETIDTRELVKKRLARCAALIVGCKALTAWGASTVDNGFRGELECIVAKIFGADAQFEIALDHSMKTHGGRSFLKGHLVAENAADYMAPKIYEGEGEMLSMAFFKSLAKEHGMDFMLPVGRALKNVMRKRVVIGSAAAIFALVAIVSCFFHGLAGTAALASAAAGLVLGWGFTGRAGASPLGRVKSLVTGLFTLNFSKAWHQLKNLALAGGVGVLGMILVGKIGVHATKWLAGPAAEAVAGWCGGSGILGMLGTGAGYGLIGLAGLLFAVLPAIVVAVALTGAYDFLRHGESYSKWFAWSYLRSFCTSRSVPGMNKRLQKHVNFALAMFAKLRLELSSAMVKHQIKLADRQCRIVHLSERVQSTVVIMATAMYAHSKGDEATTRAADILCQDLTRKLTGAQPSDEYFADCVKLADLIREGKFADIAEVPTMPVMQGYPQLKETPKASK